MKTTLYLVRHGQTLWNLEERMQGQLNSALTEQGIQQAQALAHSLPVKEITCGYLSPSLRAVETAKLITQQLTIPLIEVAELQEIKMGPWESCQKATIQAQYPSSWEHFWQAPQLYQPNGDGESFLQLQQRAVSAINRICRLNQGQTILIVSHRITIKVLLAYFLNQPLADLWKNGDILPTSLSCVQQTADGNWQVSMYSDTSHYQP